MNFFNTEVNQVSESKDFPVSTASLKEVRTFSRDVFEKINLPQEQKDELVLAIAEAAQNIVKHGYKGVEQTTDKMEIKISLKDGNLEIGFFDKGKAVEARPHGLCRGTAGQQIKRNRRSAHGCRRPGCS